VSAHPRCTATRADGAPCQAPARGGTALCRWHDPSPEAKSRHREESRRGGLAKAYNALPAIDSLTDDPTISQHDPNTAEGLRACVAVAIRALFKLPFDVRVAKAVASLATAQRALIEASDLERRLAALEAAQAAPNDPSTPSHLRAV
jgi:hypothetical protein